MWSSDEVGSIMTGGGSGGGGGSAAASPSRPPPPPPSSYEVALAKNLRSHSLSLRSAFLELDVDRDGYVTRSDLRAALHNALGVDLSVEQMDAIFVRFAYFEDDHRNGADYDESDEADEIYGTDHRRRRSQTSTSSAGSGRGRTAVHHGIKYAEFVRYIEATLLPSASSSSAYGSTVGLSSTAAGGSMMAVRPPPDATQRELRKTLARVMRQRTKSGGATGARGGKKAQLFLEMNTARDGRVSVQEFVQWAGKNGVELDQEQAKMALGEHYRPDKGVNLKEFSVVIEELFTEGGKAMPWELENDGDKDERRRGIEAGAKAQAEADKAARERVEKALKACVDDAMSDRELVKNLGEKLFERRTRMIDAFKKFDKDKDGKLDAEELMAALKEAGMTVSEERAESLVKKFDRHGDGRLNRGDFVKLISYGGEEDESDEEEKGGGVGKENEGSKAPQAGEKTESEAPAPQPKPQAYEAVKPLSKPQRADSRQALKSSLQGHEDESKHAEIVDSLDDDDVATIMSFREALHAERIMTRKVFMEMDKDGTKDLDQDELREGFQRLGLEVSDEHIRHIMRRFDPNNTGRLRYYQFVKLMSASLDDH